MNELIKITEYDGKRAVSARELHSFLECNRQFTDWIKYRINQYGFIENVDYVSFSQICENGGRSIEYALTVDMAKELSMVEGNEKGKQARQYFIECEKRSKSLDFSNPDTVLMLAQNWKEERDKRLEAERQIEAQAPKVLFADSVSTSDGSVLVAELAKILKQNGIEIGQNRMFIWLRENGYLCSKGEYYNKPSQKAMDLGLFELKKQTITKPDGTVLVSTTPKVTGKGQVYFINKFLNAA